MVNETPNELGTFSINVGKQTTILVRIARWLLLFLEYNFILTYKLGKTHVVVDVLFRLPHTIEPIGNP
jgi:hypothetical protein